MLFPSLQIPAVLLYAETHFKFFKLLPSLLFRKEPEILFDLPRRIDPDKNLPIMLICNDINRFPIKIENVSIAISQKGKKPVPFIFNDPEQYKVEHSLKNKSDIYLFSIDRKSLESGVSYINCKATVSNRNRCWDVLNDNLFATSKMPFTCLLSEFKLPGSNSCLFGDIHIHSQYSESHIEFGPPINIIDTMIDSSGLDFYSITDHSYDLACRLDDFLKSDATLSRWIAFLNDSKQELKKILILGEEISCINSENRSIHLCALNIRNYIAGCIDGARKNKLGTFNLKDAIQNIHSQGGVAIAAHPGSRFGVLQRLLLKRGSWQLPDMMQDIDAVQAVNNGFKKSWNISKALWINELLKGRKISLVAGNDSHGDFNRYRYISMPFISIAEDFERFLGFAKTGIYGKNLSVNDIAKAIKDGATFVTSGPYLQLSQFDTLSNTGTYCNSIRLGTNSITAIIKSNYEFGGLDNLKLFLGKYSEKKEVLFYNTNYSNNEFEKNETIPITNILEKGYLRAELTCRKNDGSSSFAATSPIYLS